MSAKPEKNSHDLRIKQLEHALKEMAQALEESRLRERRLNQLIDAARHGIWTMDSERKTSYVNDRMAEILGYTPEEMIGKPIVDFIFEEDREDHKKQMQLRLQGQGDVYERRIRRKDGQAIWAQIAPAAFDGNGEEFRGAHAFFTDVTERKLAEEALRDSEEKYRKTFESITDSITITRVEDGQYLYVNDGFCDQTEYSREEVIGKTPKDISLYVDPKEREMFIGILKEYGQAKDVRVRFKRKSGEEYVSEFSARPLRYGGEDCLLAQSRDITERVRAEEEKEELARQLQQAMKIEAIGRLAGGVAHDFNNMLSVIIGHAELAMEIESPQSPIYGDLEEILKAAERSAHLTRQLLAFARKQTAEPQVIQLNEAVQGMLKMLRRLIGEDIDLSWFPGDDLWQVKIDPAQIDQILANLVVNSRDAINGVGKISIKTHNTSFDQAFCERHPVFSSGDYVLLAVSDDGCGMDPETLEHIFEPFYSTKDITEGTGLGLSTVYGIIKQNNGFVNVYSEPGEGATFYIYLPKFAGVAHGGVDSEVEDMSPDTPCTILMVEDEPAILKLGKAMLERLGYTVLSSNTPQEAILLAREYEGDIHLLITDVVMPEMNGKDLAQAIIGIRPEAKCLFMSGYTADIITDRGVLEQGVDFLEKPFTKKSLSLKVKQVLQETN